MLVTKTGMFSALPSLLICSCRMVVDAASSWEKAGLVTSSCLFSWSLPCRKVVAEDYKATSAYDNALALDLVIGPLYACDSIPIMVKSL